MAPKSPASVSEITAGFDRIEAVLKAHDVKMDKAIRLIERAMEAHEKRLTRLETNKALAWPTR